MADVLESALQVVDEALASADRERRDKVRQGEQEALALRQEYLQILCRSKLPQAGDDKRLAELILEMGLTARDVKSSAAAIADAERAIGILAERKKRDEAHREAVQARDEMAARHRREIDEATRAVNAAASLCNQAHWATRDLQRAWKETPEIFSDGLLKMPASVAGALPESPAVRTPRQEPQQRFWINDRWVEPLLGADGRYLRDENGKVMLPVRQRPEPLLDERGQPRVDQRGKLVFPPSGSGSPQPVAEVAQASAGD